MLYCCLFIMMLLEVFVYYALYFAETLYKNQIIEWEHIYELQASYKHLITRIIFGSFQRWNRSRIPQYHSTKITIYR